jgi:hypothetical protein
MKFKSIGGHQSANSRTDEWLTPPEIIRSLGLFDLDPCSPINRPWDTAKHHFTIEDHGLLQEWFGRVWLNPPYGKALEAWMEKMSLHNNGISLVFARTETQFFQRFVFPVADSILFLEGRITFCNKGGMRARFDGGAPSVLIAYGEQNGDCLASCGLRGRHVPINNIPVIVITVSPSCKNVVSIAITRLNGSANLERIYSMVETIAPDKIAKNKFWKEKIRQQLQQSFQRIKKGHYSAN